MGFSSQQHGHQLKWILYASLLILRFLGIFQRGYIHPDEFFQGGQELFFGVGGVGGGGVGGRNGDELDINGADDYFAKNVPWEFEPNHAVRSIVPPSFMTLLPLRLYVTLRDYWIRFHEVTVPASISTVDDDLNDDTLRKSWLDSFKQWTTPDNMNLSGREILLVPRLFMAVLSVIFLDGSLWTLTKLRRSNEKMQGSVSNKSGPPIEVIIMASSWPCLVFGVRPFTNTLEAMVLAFLLVIVAMHVSRNEEFQHRKGTSKFIFGNIRSLLLIGATCSVGVFVRFTFVFFALPVVGMFLWKRWESLGFTLWNIVRDGSVLAVSFLVISSAFIMVDTQYYSRQAEFTCTKFGCMLNYIAPFNAFRYNSNRSNLAKHGLHPRVTHLVVNLPMLFGPVALVGYGSAIRNLCRVVTSAKGAGYSNVETICQSTIVFGLILLSCAPHQEPRFLLPVIVPLVFLYGQKGIGSYTSIRKSRATLALWIAFNLVCYIFFGWLHQGGLLQSLLQLEDFRSISNGSESGHQPLRVIIYHKTYMPPTFLTHGTSKIKTMEEACEVDSTKKTCARDSAGGTDVILDLKGADSTVLQTVLRKWLNCNSRKLDVSLESVDELFVSADDIVVYLMSPLSALAPLVESQSEAVMMLDEYSILSSWDYHGHITTEDWPAYEGSVTKFLSQLMLGMHAVSCNR